MNKYWFKVEKYNSDKPELLIINAIIAANNKTPVLLIGTFAPGNYGEQYKLQFDAIFTDLVEEKNIAYIDSYFKPMLDDVKNGKDVSYLLQSDGLHPNPAGVKVIVEYISPRLLKFLRKEKIIQWVDYL